jgi:hypothetical protein
MGLHIIYSSLHIIYSNLHIIYCAIMCKLGASLFARKVRPLVILLIGST